MLCNQNVQKVSNGTFYALCSQTELTKIKKNDFFAEKFICDFIDANL